MALHLEVRHLKLVETVAKEGGLTKATNRVLHLLSLASAGAQAVQQGVSPRRGTHHR